MLLVLVLLSALNYSSSAPTAVHDTRTGDAHVPLRVFWRQLPGCVDPTRYRTTQEILWSCLATIFACTWVAVHPNLPGPYDSRLTKFKRKLLTMIYAAIAPEMMMMWAIRQWGAAQRIADTFNKANKLGDNTCQELPWYSLHRPSDWLRGPNKYPSKRWTRTHGFFVQMGGFILFKGDIPKRVLGSTDLQEMIDNGTVDAPTIREDEIQDRSKGDFLAKLFVVLQTTWFTIQCLARWASHLAVTELEVVTLAFAVLNAITYWFWWDKPQNVLVAVAVPMKAGTDCDMMNGEGEGEGDRLDEKERWVIRKMREELNNGWIVWLGVPYRISQAILRPLKKMMDAGVYEIHRGSLRVPMFYAETSGIGIEAFPILFAALLFGGLHLIAWSSSFPSVLERWLWRSSALLITIDPILGIISAIADDVENWVSNTLFAILAGPFILGLLLYIPSRLILLVLAFATLRHLPPDAHTTVNWVTFLPHI